jgi:hypothetical protein
VLVLSMGRIFKQAVEMCSSTTIYVPSFVMIGSVIQNLLWGGIHIQTQTCRQQCDLIRLTNNQTN